MKNKILLLSLCLYLGACQNKPAEQTVVAKQPVVETTTRTPKKELRKDTPTAPAPVSPGAEEIQQTQALTAYIKKKMTEKLWHFESAFVVGSPEKGKAYQGKWIKFNPDNTLLSGSYEEAGHQGRWVYDEGKDILTVMEGGERPNYTQWKVQFSSNSDDLAIWVGTKRFQNNNTQIKMLRREAKPVK